MKIRAAASNSVMSASVISIRFDLYQFYYENERKQIGRRFKVQKKYNLASNQLNGTKQPLMRNMFIKRFVYLETSITDLQTGIVYLVTVRISTNMMIFSYFNECLNETKKAKNLFTIAHFR